MRAFVGLRLPDGSRAEVGHGDLVGRSASAALFLDDPRISEAHAMVSLRRGDLYLLALRRLLGLDGKPVSEVRLAVGQEIELAAGLMLEVAELRAPSHVLALRAPELGTRVLAQVSSLLATSPPRLVGRFVPDAHAHLWSVGDEWHVRVGKGAVQRVAPGDELTVGTSRFQVCAIPIQEAGPTSTIAGAGVAAPLRLVAYYDSVELHQRGRPVVTVGGVGARILSELIAFSGPVSWEVVARELWRDGDAAALRHRWDVALGRLRARLRDGGIRADLIRTDGSGQLALVLYQGDEVDDRT